MKKHIRDELLRRLESGEYEQCASHLRISEKEFCVTGLLCDIVAPQEWENIEGSVYLHHGNWKTPADFILHESGINSDQALLLINRNDNGMSFPQLAQYIREHIPETE